MGTKREDGEVLVDKDKFDALLRRMLKADPTQRKDIEVDEKKPGKIIPPSP
jgi:hypothetical protein